MKPIINFHARGFIIMKRTTSHSISSYFYTILLCHLSGGNVVFNQNGEATNFSVQGDVDANLLFVQGLTNAIGIGTASPMAKLDIVGSNSTLPVAQITGNTAKSALIVNQTGTGDLFTASQSGATKFVINNVGNVGIGTNNPTSSSESAHRVRHYTNSMRLVAWRKTIQH